MNWWCSATGAPWTWTWRPYPGVWLAVLALVVLYVRWRRALERVSGAPWGAWRTASFVVGGVLVWAALDWPIGALGAGYLVSLHELQWLLLAQITPALLLLSVPPAAWRSLAQRPRWSRLVRGLAHPLLGFVTFNGVMLVTHVPALADALMATQVGSFVTDLAWFASGFALWWPVLAPPGVSRMSAPARIGYLFAATIVPTAPAAFLTFADYPVYRIYELAPRVGTISAHQDQQVAGLLMKVLADPIMWVSMAIIFFRWSAAEREAEAAAQAARLARGER